MAVFDTGLTYTLSILGEPGVGKASLISRFINGEMQSDYEPTTTNEFEKQVLIDGKPCVIEVIDTAGQEDFPALREQWIRENHCFIFVYSVDSHRSFRSMDDYFERLLRIKEDELHRLGLVLAGNKCDLMDERSVKREQGLAKAKEWNEKGIRTRFFETSAKESINCEEVFLETVRLVNDQGLMAHMNDGDNDGSSCDGGCCMIL